MGHQPVWPLPLRRRLLGTGSAQDVPHCVVALTAGVIPRMTIDAVTTHSTYVLSLIRWLEGNLK